MYYVCWLGLVFHECIDDPLGRVFQECVPIASQPAPEDVQEALPTKLAPILPQQCAASGALPSIGSHHPQEDHVFSVAIHWDADLGWGEHNICVCVVVLQQYLVKHFRFCISLN